MRLPRNTANYAVLSVLLGVLALFLVYPIVLTISGALTRETPQGTVFTLSHVRLVFQDPALRVCIFNSFTLAACTTLLSIVIALPLAVCSARYQYPLKPVFNALILVPLILPPFVGAIGMQMILGREGALNALLGTHFDILGRASFWGIVAVQALSLYPIIFLNATAALANLDPALDEAAQNLGAGAWRRFFRITLPLIRPGLFAGATIVFIWSFTELGTPLVFDYRDVTPVQIFNGLKEVETSAQPYALTLVMLTAAVGCYWLGKLVFGRKAYAMYAKASRAASERPLSRPAGMAVTGAFLVVTLLALLPHIGVVLAALSGTGAWYRSVLPTRFTLDNFHTALSDPEAFGSIVNSLKLASAAMVVDLLLGLLIGYIIVRTTIRGRGLLDALAMLPLAVPGLVMAFGYIAITLRWPFGGRLPDGIQSFLSHLLPGGWVESISAAPLRGVVSVVGATPNPVLLLVIAYAVRRLPYMVRATVAGLEQTSGELEEAAMNLGATRVYAVRKVIVPLIAANLVAGCLLAFSFAMLEVSDSLLLAQQQKNYPVTKAIVSLLNRLGDGPHIASAMGVWGMALLAVTLVGASILIGKKLGSIFRV